MGGEERARTGRNCLEDSQGRECYRSECLRGSKILGFRKPAWPFEETERVLQPPRVQVVGGICPSALLTAGGSTSTLFLDRSLPSPQRVGHKSIFFPLKEAKTRQGGRGRGGGRDYGGR